MYVYFKSLGHFRLIRKYNRTARMRRRTMTTMAGVEVTTLVARVRVRARSPRKQGVMLKNLAEISMQT
jgi:hypothetical protein